MAYVLFDANNNIIDVQPSKLTCTGYTLVDDLDTNVISWLVSSNNSLSFLQFTQLFTQAEQIALATSADPITRLFVMQATGASGIQLSNTVVSGGINYVASKGIIANTRVSQIMTGQCQGSNSVGANTANTVLL